MKLPLLPLQDDASYFQFWMIKFASINVEARCFKVNKKNKNECSLCISDLVGDYNGTV